MDCPNEHHDHAARAADVRRFRPSASPATPGRRLLGRERFGFPAFMKEPGEKRLLQVDSERGYDGRMLMANFCPAIVELRNVRSDLARDNLLVLRCMPAIPPRLRAPLWDLDCLEKGSRLIHTLTELIDHWLATGASTQAHVDTAS